MDADKEGFLRSERSLVQTIDVLHEMSTDLLFCTPIKLLTACNGPLTKPSAEGKSKMNLIRPVDWNTGVETAGRNSQQVQCCW